MWVLPSSSKILQYAFKPGDLSTGNSVPVLILPVPHPELKVTSLLLLLLSQLQELCDGTTFPAIFCQTITLGTHMYLLIMTAKPFSGSPLSKIQLHHNSGMTVPQSFLSYECRYWGQGECIYFTVLEKIENHLECT